MLIYTAVTPTVCVPQVRLLSEDYGKHLMGVEDLMQKHSLLESDIGVVGTRVKTINGQAQKYVDGDFPDMEGWWCQTHLNLQLIELLLSLAAVLPSCHHNN